MSTKQRLQEIVADMSEEEAIQTLALAEAVRAGMTAADFYGPAWNPSAHEDHPGLQPD